MGDEPARPSWLYLATPGEGAVREEGDDGIGAASRAFSFPYPAAYRIQIDLMQAVFRAIEDGKVGLFESPTGTVSARSRKRSSWMGCRAHCDRGIRGSR